MHTTNYNKYKQTIQTSCFYKNQKHFYQNIIKKVTPFLPQAPFIKNNMHTIMRFYETSHKRGNTISAAGVFYNIHIYNQCLL